MSTDEDRVGYSLRRNSTCVDGEQDCGGTWNSFRRCCPEDTVCPAGTNTPGICCPTTKNCEAALKNKQRCADTTADLYPVQSSDGFFCCANDTQGFYTPSNDWVGCAKAQDMKDFSDEAKAVVPAVQSRLPTSSSSTTSTSLNTPGTISATPTPTDNANTGTSHSNNAGPIAGGVVGGIAGVVILIGLAWCLFRRRRKHSQESQYIQPPPGPVSELSGSNQITELSGQSVSELPGSEHRKFPPAELAS